MDIKEYISSGILELYVFNQLSPEERLDVERMADLHLEVKQEIYEISKAMGQYAQMHAIAAPEGTKASILNKITDSLIPKVTSKSNTKWNGLNSFLLATSIGLLSFYFWQKSTWSAEKSNYERQLIKCDSLEKANQVKYVMIEDLKNENIAIVKIGATPKFPATSIHLHTNKVDKKNYLQLNNLPDLPNGKAYQLWALKDGQAPQPLTVFNDQDAFVKVDYVDGTKTYAITIEDAAGAQSPNLADLIGTFGVE